MVVDTARYGGTMRYHEPSITVSVGAFLRKSKGFEDVKQQLREIRAKYMMLYTAMLKLIQGGEARRFDSPDKAMAFVDPLR